MTKSEGYNIMGNMVYPAPGATVEIVDEAGARFLAYVAGVQWRRGEIRVGDEVLPGRVDVVLTLRLVSPSHARG